jgi:pyruvate dehydrogenase E2 component (dihydrolipoamide acetyltransferase)
MTVVVRMPSILAGAREGAIASWLVAPGDTVAVGMPIAEIETEKALVEYSAEAEGIVGRLVVGAGGTAEIGDPIAVLVTGGETDADIDAALGLVPEPAAAAAVRTADAAAGAAPDRTAPSRAAGTGRSFASPLVRKLAGERGISIARLSGTGPNGRVVRRDLERFVAAESAGPARPLDLALPRPAPAVAEPSAAPSPPASATLPQPALVPHTPMRRAIARRLSQSKATVPHFYLTAEPAVDDMLALRTQVNESSTVRVSVNDFVIAAVAAAFGDVPEANVTWTEEGLLTHDSVDISLAVATDAGLVTPVLRGVQDKKVSAIARESAALVQRARERKLRQQELEGGSFTVSNLGMYGTPEFSAIINPPQSAVLAVGAARQQPVVRNGAVVPATVMRCVLSVDHRAIDGALAARWLAAFTERLEHPLSAIV